MFKIGKRIKSSFGSFTVDKEFDVNFKYMDEPIRPNSRIYTIVKIYILTGKGNAYVGISDKGHILKLPDKIAIKYIK